MIRWPHRDAGVLRLPASKCASRKAVGSGKSKDRPPCARANIFPKCVQPQMRLASGPKAVPPRDFDPPLTSESQRPARQRASTGFNPTTELGCRAQLCAARPARQPRRCHWAATVRRVVHVSIVSPLVSHRVPYRSGDPLRPEGPVEHGHVRQRGLRSQRPATGCGCHRSEPRTRAKVSVASCGRWHERALTGAQLPWPPSAATRTRDGAVWLKR